LILVLHFVASANTKSFPRSSFWVKPRELNIDSDHFRVGFPVISQP